MLDASLNIERILGKRAAQAEIGAQSQCRQRSFCARDVGELSERHSLRTLVEQQLARTRETGQRGQNLRKLRVGNSIQRPQEQRVARRIALLLLRRVRDRWRWCKQPWRLECSRGWKQRSKARRKRRRSGMLGAHSRSACRIVIFERETRAVQR